MWPVDQAVHLSDVSDGTSNTVIVVESEKCGINWMGPQDLDIDGIFMKISPKAERGVSSVHPGGALAAFVDGSVQFLTDALPSDVVKALLTRNDGQSIPSLDSW